MAFDPDAYLGVTKKPSGFDPDSYLANSPKRQEESFEPIPPTILAADPKEAEAIFDKYESAGKDPGFEIIQSLTPSGYTKTVRRKTYIPGDPVSLEDQKKIREKVNQERLKSVQSSTSMFDQAVEGIVRPTQELIAGAQAIASGNPEYLKSLEPVIPFADLSPEQKVAYGAASVMGYYGPGALINIAGKGLVKVLLKATAKEALAKAAQKGATRYVGQAVAKMAAPDLAKQVIGGLSGKIIKNGPMLALEGAAWEGIASGGDPARAIEGAAMFALGGPVVEMGVGALGKGLMAGGEATVKAVQKVREKPEPAVFKELARRTPESMFERVPGITDEAHQKVQKIEGFRLSAFYEAERDLLQAQVRTNLEKVQGMIARVGKTRKALESKRDLMLERISKNSNIQVEYPEPKSFEALKSKLTFGDRSLSEIGYELLVDKFGTLDGLRKAAQDEGGDLAGVLIKAGFNQEQAAIINRRLTVFNPVVRRVGPTQKSVVKLSNKDLNSVERQIAKLDKIDHQLTVKAGTIKKHPMFNPEADTKLLDMSKDQYAIGLFQKKALEAGIDISAVDMPFTYGAKKFLNYTERHSMVEAQTGVPVGQITMDLIEANHLKTHVLKASESFNIAGNLKQLRTIGVDGEKGWEWLHYVRTDRKTGQVKWDPSELKMGEYTVPEFKGEAPTQEVIDILSQFRKLADWHHNNISSTGQAIGYTPGYVPIKPKVGFFDSTARVPAKDVGKSRLLKKRSTGIISDEKRLLFHTDLYDLIPMMNRDGVNAAVFSNIAEKVNAANWLLRASGRKDMADEFLEYASRAMGYKNKKETIQVLSMELVKKNEPLLRKLSETFAPNDPGFLKDAYSALNEMMYNSYLFLSPSGLVKQFWQPEFIGAAEIGFKNVEFGRAGAFSPINRKETKAALDRVRGRLVPEKIDYAQMGEVQRRYLKNFVKLMNIPAMPGSKVFSFLERKNRETMFLGAIHQFKQASKKGGKEMSEILDDLLPAERTRVLEAFNKYGAENAMDTYGLIRSKRTNYAYNLAEKAEAFSTNPVMSNIPFVSWGLNQWMRHMEAVKLAAKGKPMPLVAYVAYGTAGTIAVQQLMNERFYPQKLGPVQMSSGLPQSAMVGFTELSPLTLPKAVASGEVSSWIRYYKKTNGDILNPAKLFKGNPKTKKQRKLKGDYRDVIEFKRK